MDSPRRSQRANKGVPPRRYGDFVGGDEIDEVASNHSEETVLADNGNGENVNANGERKSSSPAKLPLEPEVRVISRHSSYSSLSSKRSRRSQAETVKAKLQISIEETKLKLELLSLEKQLANVQEELDQSLDSDDFVSESDGTELRLPVPNGKVRGGSDEVRKENIQFSKIQAQSTPIKQCSDTNYHTAFEPTVFPEVESGVAPEGAPKVPAIQKKRNMPIVPQKIVPEGMQLRGVSFQEYHNLRHQIFERNEAPRVADLPVEGQNNDIPVLQYANNYIPPPAAAAQGIAANQVPPAQGDNQVPPPGQNPPGVAVLLPSSFPGSPRNMVQRYSDAMSMMAALGKPVLFITFSCNPTWPEMVDNLKPYWSREDQVTLQCRSGFHITLKDFVKQLVDDMIFGRVKYYTYSIEFQKRGLPHAHFLIGVHSHDKLYTPEQVDFCIFAEILRDSMEVVVRQQQQPEQLPRDNCHINVEYCTMVTVAKYLFKYIFKGVCQANVQLTVGDEIQNYEACRFLTSPEAAWQLLCYETY
ncbi:uncharacterized protein DMENIID0001_132240 [Sergentomyia squamirostris]